jgi:Ca2+-binding RTX toxin-like protein
VKNHARLNGSRAARRAAAAMAVSVAAAATGATGIIAGSENAAASTAAGQARYYAQDFNFKHPRLEHGLLTIEGTAASDRITLRLKAGHPRILQVDVGHNGPANFSFNRAHIAKIIVAARGGDDNVQIDESNGAFTNTIETTIAGGSGNDTLSGGSGAETFLGGYGNDAIDGNGGNDLALMGSGDDTFTWDPGDGSDTIDGQSGNDTMRFNGAGGAEQIVLSANGSHLKFTRDVATITMDTVGVEQVDFNALGGADAVTVNDLTGTDVTGVAVDLAGALGGAAGDGQPDRVIIEGTAGDDAIGVSGDASAVKVSGLAPTTRILHPEAANDRVEVNTLAGTDTVASVGLVPGSIQLLVDGVLVP